MRLSVLSSGSSGNATYIESGSGGVLVDAGLSCRRLKLMLARIGRSLGDVGMILITHAHGDHTNGLRSILREREIPIIATPAVAASMKIRSVTACEACEMNGLSADFFEVPHDAPTFGLRLTDGTRTVTVATDLGELPPETLRIMRGTDALVLEANHDPDWLKSGPYSADLKRRVASPKGHLSNYQTAEIALALAPYGLKDVVLAHLSRTNNSPARATGTVSRVLREGGHGSIRVRAALAGHPTPVIDVGAPLVSSEYVYRYQGSEESAARLFGIE